MDARLDPAKYAGLSEGDAHVIRNAGGRASDDAIRSLVISYKLLGSHDVQLSSTISADHYYDLAWRVSRASSIPPQIGEIISNSPVVFLGCSILDSEFRVSYHTLLRHAFEIQGHKRLALCEHGDVDHQDIAHKMGVTNWESLRSAALSVYKIELIHSGIKPFLEMLREGVAKRERGAQ